MAPDPDTAGPRPAWFVGAAFAGGTEDRTDRFIREGVWEHGFKDRYLEDVKSIRVGDRIAIKSTYNRKHGLPFDNRGHAVAVMAIKAVGVVTNNPGDGRRLTVDWTPVEPNREWYFYTYQPTVWRVISQNYRSTSLIDFTFGGQDQDIDKFRNLPYWRDRFGDNARPESEPAYSVDDIMAEGCFLERTKLEAILERWRVKKNLILQGPPGTGKTWLAKKLAYALIGSRSPSRVRPLQFHPNLSYEDFVRGWRPSGESDSRLDLVDGPFLTAVTDTMNEPERNLVVVIEEINRGNPAQIFGEMLTLLEADKRTPDEALALSYPRNGDERVHIPDNLYVVGTMNVADRSLALVDLALRRRFAFIDLEPVFGDPWRSWVSEQCGLDAEFLGDIERRLTTLNQTISDDDLLGPQFRVGHSVVTPSNETAITDPVQWFTQVVETEIGPLLDEYWFDATDRARSAKADLLKGLGS